ncbi:unnamed protein product [Sphagnum jensenii]|uniref:AB hydrolase-1 domain-containing protein n=1 Tax=Sphagnum jensenii TaxID=128206 RepID=A0ABP1BLQ0_9BRYO
MGGSSCLGFSFIEFKLKWLEYRFRACGLRPQLVHLMDSNNTTIHCWVPWRRTGTNNKSEEEEEEEEEACGGIGSVLENKKRKKKKKPALMLLHGFAPNALLCWENQIAAFVRDFDVYVPDLLFFGNSTTTQQREQQGEEKQRQRWSEAFQAECLMHMLQVLGVQQKQNNNNNQQQQELHVLGTSYGGMVAFRMAELYPTLVSKVVFSSSGICMSPTNNDEMLARNNLSHVSQLLLPSTVQQMRVGVATAIYKQNRIPDFLLRDFVEVLYEENRAERKQLLDDMVIGTPEAFPLPQLTQKFLVVWGEYDEIFNISLAYELQKHLGTQRAEMVVMKNCGHAPQIENPREYNCIILNFLQSPAEKSTKD